MELDDFLSAIDNTTATPSTPAVTALAPVDLQLDLLPYQEEARDFALTNESSYLALDMGLGKTAVAIAIAAASKNAGLTPIAIVVPPSLRTNWVREIQKFAPWLRGIVIDGTRARALPNVDLYIVGDSVLTHWEPQLTGRVKTLIVDEAHRHKNHDSKRAKALTTIAGGVTGRKVLLSGTPTPNGRHAELAGQLDILGQKAWTAIGGKGKFWNYYCPKVNSWGSRGNNDTQGLHQAMQSFMMRRKRDDVLELPNKGRSAIAIEGSGKAARDYPRIEDDLIAFLQGEDKSISGALKSEALVRMGLLRRTAGMAKVGGVIEHVKELLDSEPGGVFVVAENVDVMDALYDGLIKYGCAVVRGGMTDKQKTEAVDAFNSGAARVLVGQIVAAGVGLTLHGGGLNHKVVVAQLPWTPADLRQAEDRLHRIGQTHDVHVEVTLCSLENRWTIDERLWSVLEQKAFATGELIDGEGEYLLEGIQEGVLDSYR